MEIKKLKKTLKKEILVSNHVYIIGHNYIDLDAYGAMVGISKIVEKFNKKYTFIINDNEIELSVNNAINKLNNKKYMEKEVKSFNKSLLIIVDTNKDKLLSCKDVLDNFNKVIVIDHHDITDETLKVDNLFVDTVYSSTCEIVTELLRSFKINLTPNEATVILSGIVLDTNNFILKSTKRTFYNSYFLLNKGAFTIEVQYLLKQDLNKFITRQKMLTNVTIIDNIAIACGVEKELYRREDLAKIADTLLLFNNIETSFVIASLEKNEVGISARSLNKVNVGKILTKLGGGGNEYEGACKIKEKSIKEVKKELISVLK